VSVDLVAPTTAGQATVTAGVGNLNQSAAITFAAGQPAVITTAVAPTALAADGQSVAIVRARVTDAFGNPIAGLAVHFGTSLGSINGSAQTDGTGTATAPLTAPAAAGIAQVTAGIGALQSTSNVTFVQTGRHLYLPAIRR